MMTIGSGELTRRSLLVHAGLAGISSFVPWRALCAEERPKVNVFRDPSCGCCERWIEHLRQNRFVVQVADSTNMQSVKAAAGVPRELASCHTATVGGYVIEGHVPATAIKRLLAKKPGARGLAVPGMPAGSPGMEGPPPEVYDVIIFDEATSKIFARYKGTDEF